MTVNPPVRMAWHDPPAEPDGYYGPTDWDPNPGSFWHRGCVSRGEIWWFKEGWACSKCDYSGPRTVQHDPAPSLAEKARADSEVPLWEEVVMLRGHVASLEAELAAIRPIRITTEMIVKVEEIANNRIKIWLKDHYLWYGDTVVMPDGHVANVLAVGGGPGFYVVATFEEPREGPVIDLTQSRVNVPDAEYAAMLAVVEAARALARCYNRTDVAAKPDYFTNEERGLLTAVDALPAPEASDGR
jgi:hypothetical protein